MGKGGKQRNVITLDQHNFWEGKHFIWQHYILIMTTLIKMIKPVCTHIESQDVSIPVNKHHSPLTVVMCCGH